MPTHEVLNQAIEPEGQNPAEYPAIVEDACRGDAVPDPFERFELMERSLL